MNFFQRIKFAFAGAAFKLANITFLPEWATAAFTTIGFQALVREGVKANSAVFACLERLTSGFTEAPLIAVNPTTGAQEENPAVTEFLTRLNPDISNTRLFQLALGFTAISGNAYLWIQRSASGDPVALWPLSDYNITPEPGRSTMEGIIRHYILEVEGQKTKLKKEDILHFIWEPDPERPERGYGALQAAARDTDIDNEVAYYAFRLLKNDAVPRMVINLVEGEEFDEGKAKRLRTQWIDKYSGLERGGPAFLEAGMTAKVLGLDLNSLQFDALRKLPESRISAAFRVPAIVAGLSVGLDHSTYANYSEAREAMTEDTLIPLWAQWADVFNHGIGNAFGGGFQFQFNLKVVRSLSKDVDALWTRIVAAWNASLITRTEAKEAIGLETTSNDEVYKVSLATEFVAPGTMSILPEDGTDGTASAVSYEAKAQHENGIKIARSLRRTRLFVAGRMSQELEMYFDNLAKSAISRAYAAGKGSEPVVETKLAASTLITPEDEAALKSLYLRYFVEMMSASWEAINISLGAIIAFDLNDPLVVSQLSKAGTKVKGIMETTRDVLATNLQKAHEAGLSVNEMVAGNSDLGIRGIRDIVSETYRGRAKTIARTELGEAQNLMTLDRYEKAGAKHVVVLDNELLDSHPTCKWLNGQERTLEWTKNNHPGEGPDGVQNPLQHPNCVRAFGPIFK